MKLNSGTKIRMLNNCAYNHFKKDDILTIDVSMYNSKTHYYCKESTLNISKIQINIKTDKFKIIDLDILKELGD